MVYSEEQKKAIIRIMVELMDADGSEAQDEKAYCKHVCNELGVDKDFFVAAEKYPFYQALIAVKEMAEEQKKSLSIMMQQMAMVDGQQNIYEHAVWQQVANYAGLPNL